MNEKTEAASSKNKADYIQFSAAAPGLMIYMLPWWLDAVAGPANWDVSLCRSNTGEIMGALPYCMKKKYGINMIIIPYLSHFCGLWIRPSVDEKLHRRYGYVKKILADLIAGLPDAHFTLQKYHYDLLDAQPFYWKGFTTSIQYSYLIEDLTDLNQVFFNFSGSLKNEIRAAAKVVRVETQDDVEPFLKLQEMTFEKQGMKNPVPLEIWRRLDAVLKEKNKRVIYYARDLQTGELHSAQYILKDDKVAYGLGQGNDLKYRHTGAGKLLLWQAIQDAAQWANVFDFRGSMLPGVEPVFRSFGAKQTPFIKVFRARNTFYKLLNVFLNISG